jgi:hypothetical protein
LYWACFWAVLGLLLQDSTSCGLYLAALGLS